MANIGYDSQEFILGAKEGVDARIIAGGQSLMAMLNMRLARPKVLVDIMRIGALDRIDEIKGEIVIGAGVRQAKLLVHTSNLFYHEYQGRLAAALTKISGMDRAFFTNSGTEANEYAVQLARMFTGRFEIVALRHGYSGRSQLAQSMTAHSTWRKSLPVPAPGVVHARR